MSGILIIYFYETRSISECLKQIEILAAGYSLIFIFVQLVSKLENSSHREPLNNYTLWNSIGLSLADTGISCARRDISIPLKSKLPCIRPWLSWFVFNLVETFTKKLEKSEKKTKKKLFLCHLASLLIAWLKRWLLYFITGLIIIKTSKTLSRSLLTRIISWRLRSIILNQKLLWGQIPSTTAGKLI